LLWINPSYDNPDTHEEDDENAWVDENPWVDDVDVDDMLPSSDDGVQWLEDMILHGQAPEHFLSRKPSQSSSHPSIDKDPEFHGAILRTNRQIYSEASSLLYTECTLVVEPGDIFCLGERVTGPRRFGVPSERVWRHNPLHGLGTTGENGVVTYDTPPMRGKLDPHVFARFQKISFDASFGYDHTQFMEIWMRDDNTVNPSDAVSLKDAFRQSPVIQNFVKLMSCLPKIVSLEIELEVEIMCNCNAMAQMPDDSDDESEELEEQVDKIMDVANERATELFLDSNTCEPLLQLTNVSQFDFKFGFDHREENERYTPLPRHLKLFSDMKKVIEGNFTEKMASLV